MDIIYIKKEKVIERYLDKKLSDDELAQFEIYYLDNPEVLCEIYKIRVARLSQKIK